MLELCRFIKLVLAFSLVNISIPFWQVTRQSVVVSQ